MWILALASKTRYTRYIWSTLPMLCLLVVSCADEVPNPLTDKDLESMLEVKADFTVTPTSGSLKTDFQVDANSSAGKDLLFHWDWEWNETDHPHTDANFTKEKKASHIYTTPGEKKIRLLVKNSSGKTDTKTIEITVGNTTPTASITISPSNAKGDRATTFRFDASSSKDEEDNIADLEVKWDWGDGTVENWGKEKIAIHSFGTVGEKTIVLEVRDTIGDIDKKEEKVTILPDKPSNPAPSDGASDQDLNITLKWDGTPITAGRVVYDIYFGTSGDLRLIMSNAPSVSLNSPNLQFKTTYFWKVVSKVASDPSISSEGEVWKFTTKGNTPPVASFDVRPSSGNRSTIFNVDASESKDEEDSNARLEVRWDWEDDGIFDTSFSTLKNASHQYTAIKERSELKKIRLEVRDTAGAIANTTKTVTVENRPPTRPTNPKPAHKALNQPTKVNLSWTADDPDGDQLTYELFLAKTPNFGPADKQPPIKINSFDPPTLDGSKEYFWKVVVDDGFDSVEGSVWSFTTNQPPTVELISDLIGFKRDEITINVKPQDEDGQIDRVIFEYSLDNINWKEMGIVKIPPYSLRWNSDKDLPKFAQNVWVRAIAVDNNGDKSNPDKIAKPFSIDNELPTTKHDYDNRWHKTDITIKLAADDFKGSGVKATKYKINNGSELDLKVNGQPLIKTEGANNVLEFWSLDEVGNEETHQFIREIKLDKRKPSIRIGAKTPTNLEAKYTGNFKVELNITDNGGSGLKTPQFDHHIGAANWLGFKDMTRGSGDIWTLEIPQPSEGWSKYAEQTLFYKVQVQDAAGNESTLESEERIKFHPLLVPKLLSIISDANFPFRDPVDIAISPDGSRCFVTNSVKDGYVSVIDTATNRVLKNIRVGAYPTGLALNPIEPKVYAANSGSDSFSIIDYKTNEETSKIPIRGAPTRMAISVFSAYVSSKNTNLVSEFSLQSGKLVSEIPVGNEPLGLSLSEGGLLYVANSLSNNISEIDILTNKVSNTIPVGERPTSIIESRDQNIYVLNSGTGDIFVIDQIEGRVVKKFKVGREPRGIAVIRSESGDFLYVTNSSDNSLTAIEVATGFTNTIENIGLSPLGIAATPDGKKLYIVSSDDATVLVMGFSTGGGANRRR